MTVLIVNRNKNNASLKISLIIFHIKLKFSESESVNVFLILRNNFKEILHSLLRLDFSLFHTQAV